MWLNRLKTQALGQVVLLREAFQTHIHSSCTIHWAHKGSSFNQLASVARMTHLCVLPGNLWQEFSAEIMKPPSCTILNMVGLLYQGQYDLSPGFNYHLCGWHTILLVCTELNPWVQSCITKATIFSASKVRRHMHGLTKDFFFLICELFIWRLAKIQKFNHLWLYWI